MSLLIKLICIFNYILLIIINIDQLYLILVIINININNIYRNHSITKHEYAYKLYNTEQMIIKVITLNNIIPKSRK